VQQAGIIRACGQRTPSTLDQAIPMMTLGTTRGTRPQNRYLFSPFLPGPTDTLWAHKLGEQTACSRHEADIGSAMKHMRC
jgi:hypothetical protein